MEEKKAYGLVMVFVGVFVLILVSIMSYSLWRDRQVNAFMTTNRAWGIQCDTVSQAAWVVRDGERVDLQINHLPLYCSCLLYTSPSPRDLSTSRMPSSA